jgi:5-methyltetrahydropteroyltriglutamate--homocysteine methyltransferase
VTFPLLARSSVNQVSVECAASGVDLAVLRELGDKGVMFGAINVGTEEVESADTVANRLRGALQHVPPERLFPCTDCGLVPRSREASRGKMRALAQGAAIVRAEVSSTTRRALTVS